MIQLDLVGNLRDLNLLSLCVRLLLAMAFGGTIGFERGIRQRAAGLRTHMLLCVGAASTMLVSQFMYSSYGVGDDLLWYKIWQDLFLKPFPYVVV